MFRTRAAEPEPSIFDGAGAFTAIAVELEQELQKVYKL